jgi:alpha-ketoglutarate-dependent taurine dioxygenase
MAKIDIQPLDPGVAFGAKVTGITSEALDDEGTRAKLRELLHDRGVIVAKHVEQSPAMQVKLSEVFGPLKDHPVYEVERADRENLKGVIVIASGPGSCIVEVKGKPLVTFATPDEPGRKLLMQAADAMWLSARGYTRMLRVSRTIADLAGAESVGRIHIAEALSYRRQPPRA